MCSVLEQSIPLQDGPIRRLSNKQLQIDILLVNKPLRYIGC